MLLFMKFFFELKIRIVILLSAIMSIFAGFVYAEDAYEAFPAQFNLTNINGNNGFAINGINAEDAGIGYSVSGAGDVNGDGIADIVIGAPNANNVAGQSYVVFGSKEPWPVNVYLTTLNGSNGFAINGINPNDGSGLSVSGAGDVNGDGIDDILIGAPGNNANTGQSYVVFGSREPFPAEFNLINLNGTNGFAINGIYPFDSCGHSVSGAGDVNGDGIADILIGAPTHSALIGQGQSYVVFGSKESWPAAMNLSDLNGNNGFTINGINSQDVSGWSVSRAGDVNGDGLDDILIGAAGAYNKTGQSYVVFGNKGPWPADFYLITLNGNNGFAINGINAGDAGIGYSVSGAGDVNGDGLDDILIGASGAYQSIGQSYVVFGSTGRWPEVMNLKSLNGDNGFAINGINPGDESGYFVSGTGDVNGDDIVDILIGAQFANNQMGQSYVVFGSKKSWPAYVYLYRLNGTNGFVINGIKSGDWSGNSVSGAGDVNGDGIADILIGAIGSNNNTGQTYVVFGEHEISAEP